MLSLFADDATLTSGGTSAEENAEDFMGIHKIEIIFPYVPHEATEQAMPVTGTQEEKCMSPNGMARVRRETGRR
jgi:hypothetical protein